MRTGNPTITNLRNAGALTSNGLDISVIEVGKVSGKDHIAITVGGGVERVCR
jgi:hypothetical protein